MSAGLQLTLRVESLLPTLRLFNRFDRQLSHNTALVTKTHRAVYTRQYPTILVLADGSSYTIRYHEPRPLIRLPLDVTTLSPEEMQRRLENRKPKQKVVHAKEEVDNFKTSKYVNLMRRKK